MNKKLRMILILSLIIILGWYSFLFEPNNLQVENLTIKIENLPASFEGIKIVQLADFHSRYFGRREKEILQIVDSLNPDFVFIVGDFVDQTTKNIQSCQQFWQVLGKKYKNRIYGVMGNHDYHNPYCCFLEQFLNDSGIVILDNENKKLTRGNDFIYLVGVDDPDTGYDNLSYAIKNIEEKDIPKILLAHSPEIIEDIAGQNIDLILAGHTHGGQIKIPFVRPFWVPTKYHGKYANGLFKINNSYLYVNRGVGTTFLPIRFNCPPEITLIELKKYK